MGANDRAAGDDQGYQELLEKLQAVEPGVTMESQQNRFQDEIKKGKAAVPGLLKALEEPDASVRLDAAEALGLLKAKEALAALKQTAQTDQDGLVRQHAAIAVIQTGGDTILGEVAKNLRDENPEVAAHAAVTLGRVGDRRIVPNLLEAFQTEDPYVGSAIAWALGELKDARAVSWLVAALENGFVPANAAEALGRIGDPDAVPALMNTLNHPNDDARAYAARALGLMREPAGLKGVRAHSWLERKEQMIATLKQTLEDRSLKVRVFASIALFELGVRNAGKTLISLLKQI